MRPSNPSKTLVTFLLSLLLVACQPAAITPTPTASPRPSRTAAASATSAMPTPTTAPLTPTPNPAPTHAPIALTPGADETALVDRARVDLAARLRLAESDITLVAVESAELPQSDLGCPPRAAGDGPAIPALVIGLIIRLEAGGEPYVYHAHGRRLIYCGP